MLSRFFKTVFHRVRELAPGHEAGRGQSWASNPLRLCNPDEAKWLVLSSRVLTDKGDRQWRGPRMLGSASLNEKVSKHVRALGKGTAICVVAFFLRKMIVTLIYLGKLHVSQFVVQCVTVNVAIFQTA